MDLQAAVADVLVALGRLKWAVRVWPGDDPRVVDRVDGSGGCRPTRARRGRVMPWMEGVDEAT